MTRTSRLALWALTIAASSAALLAVGAPASAAGLSVPPIIIDPTTQALVAQTITADVRGYNPVVQIQAPLDRSVFTVQIQGMAAALPGKCDFGGPGVWHCPGNLETDGKITITYLFGGVPPPPGTYTVSVSMGDNGVTYGASGTVTIVGAAASSGPASPPSSVAAPTSTAPSARTTGGVSSAPGSAHPPSQASSASPTDSATATAISVATTTSGRAVASVPAATAAMQRSGHFGVLATIAVIAVAVAAAGAAAGLLTWRRLRRR